MNEPDDGLQRGDEPEYEPWLSKDPGYFEWVEQLAASAVNEKEMSNGNYSYGFRRGEGLQESLPWVSLRDLQHGH